MRFSEKEKNRKIELHYVTKYWLNKCVLSNVLNDFTELAYLIFIGRVFHSEAAANKNVRSP